MTSRPLSRRTVLRGFGTAIALPWLEAMGQLTAWAGESSQKRVAPNRIAFLYVPNGKDMPNWTPRTEGRLGELPPILAALAPVKDDLIILTGLTADKARPYGDGGGDHARAMAAFLTGVHPRKTDGTDIRAGRLGRSGGGGAHRRSDAAAIARDRRRSGRHGGQLRLAATRASIPRRCPGARPRSRCRRRSIPSSSSSGSLARRAPRNARIATPRARACSISSAKIRKRPRGTGERERPPEARRVLHLHPRRGAAHAARGASCRRSTPSRRLKAPTGIPAELRRASAPDGRPARARLPGRCHARLHLRLANEGSNKSYPALGVNEGPPRSVAPRPRPGEESGRSARSIVPHQAARATCSTQLKEIQEGDGTLLDHCMIAYGSGNSRRQRHNHDDLPILLAGHGGGTIKTGRHIVYAKETPLTTSGCRCSTGWMCACRLWGIVPGGWR